MQLQFSVEIFINLENENVFPEITAIVHSLTGEAENYVEHLIFISPKQAKYCIVVALDFNIFSFDPRHNPIFSYR